MKRLTTLALLMTSVLALAQTPAERWKESSYLNYPTTPYVTSTEMDADGNTYVAGYRFNAADSDIFTAKYDSDGALIFKNTYNSGAGDDEGIEVGFDQFGNTYVVGNCRNGGSLFVRKFNTLGGIEWTQTYYGAIFATHANDMQVLNATGDVFIAGRSTNATSGEGVNLAVFRYDTDGNLVWEKSYDGGDDERDEAFQLTVDVSGNCYVLGEENNPSVSGTPVLLKYAYGGALGWNMVPDITGEGGSDSGVLLVEGANVGVYSWTNKKRYARSNGALNETVSFANTVNLFSGRPFYKRLTTGEYVRAVSASTIKKYNSTGGQLASTNTGWTNKFVMDGNDRLYKLTEITGAIDSSAVTKYNIGASSISTDWIFKFGPSRLNSFDISNNNTISVAYGDNDSLIVHNLCIPPDVELTVTTDIGGNNLCASDTAWLTVNPEYGTAFSWFGTGFYTNSDSIWIGPNFATNTPINLYVDVDGGNGCVVREYFDQINSLAVVEALVVPVVGNCESDPGFLFSASDPNYYEYNWYFNGIQQTFNASNDTILCTLGNGIYEMEIYNTQTGCFSVPNSSYTVTTIMPDETATLSYPNSIYAQNESDPLPSLTGTSGGTYSEATGNLSIDANSGVIDLSASSPGGPYTVVYTTPGFCSGEASFDVTIATVVGISDLDETTISVYPNPVAELLHVEGNFSSISIHTLDGKQVFKSSQNKMDVSGLASGAYLLKIEGSQTVSWRHLLKQ